MKSIQKRCEIILKLSHKNYIRIRQWRNTKMSDKVVLKMFSIFLLLMFSNISVSLADIATGENCSCYSLCNKNFTVNSIHDVQKISACQRGCRFYSLVLHKSHALSEIKSLENAKNGCLLSCSESYLSSIEVSACKYGCSANELPGVTCNSMEIPTSHISYSFLIEESDILIHPGEPEPDDALTDPGLRKQIQKKLVALLDAAPRIPEIHFRNLPVKSVKLSDLSHASFKCPKFYGLDSKLEFRNGKIIIGDLYLFVGVFIFVVLCFVLGNHIETKTMKRQKDSRFYKKEELEDKELVLKIGSHDDETTEKENLHCSPTKAEIFYPTGTTQEEIDTKFEGITLIFNKEDFTKDCNNSLKI